MLSQKVCKFLYEKDIKFYCRSEINILYILNLKTLGAKDFKEYQNVCSNNLSNRYFSHTN